jgi:hypothetical protein
MQGPRGRSGLFLVRVWLENDALLRARITEIVDLVDGPETITFTGRTDDIERRLSNWLRAFTDRNEPVTSP